MRERVLARLRVAELELELALVDELVEAGHERVELLADTLLDAVVDDVLDVLLLVVLRDGDGCADSPAWSWMAGCDLK